MTKILIVDDHGSVRGAWRDWLAVNLPACKFFKALTGEQAIVICQKEIPEIVLMDYGLTTINGIEATRRIKEILPETQIVMISIHEDQRYRVEAASAGVTHYIAKRTMQKELIPVLNEMIHKLRHPKQIPAN